MATIRELQASFIAKASGMKSTIQGVKKEINNLAKDTKKMSGGMDKNFKAGTSNVSSYLHKMSVGAQKGFESIGKSIQGASVKLESWSKDIKTFGKTTSKALSPLTAFYATAAITGGQRMAANEQLDILMRNTFRTEKAYESAWDAVNGLTKGTAFMNKDVGQWLSQLVQSNIELDKSEDIMKSILDFSVGSGQLGIEGEIHEIIMKAVRSGGWDQMTLDMLAQRGLNLAGHIANVLGIETSAAQDMLKDGTISMEESLDYFVDAVQVGSEGAGGYFAKMAGSAQKGGDTMLGAWTNVKAAIAKMGEDMWKSGAWDALKEALNSFYDFINELSPALEPMAKIIASIMATMVEWVQKLMDKFINLRPKTQALIAGLSVIGAVLGPAIYMFGSFVGAVSKALKPLGAFFLGVSKGLKLISGKTGLTGVLKTLSGRFSFLLGPIGIAIGVITLLVTAFTIAYKKSETFREFVHKLGEKIKEVFFGIVDWIKPGFDAILSFFGEMKTKISEFTNQEGAQLMDAFKNIGSVIATVASAIWKAIKWTFEQMKWIIADYVMPVVEFVIKMVWENIKGIITGALDVIMGAVKIFSGLFTGDFSKMWEGVKQLFLGAVKVVWNYINLLFIGRILKGIGVFVKSFGSFIVKMWTGAKTTFLNGIKVIWEWMKNSFIGRIISNIINFAKNFRKNLSTMWTLVKSLFSKRITEIRNSIANSFVGRIINNIINFAKNFRSNLSNMWSLVKKLFSKRITEIRNSIANSFVGRMLQSVRNLKTNFVRLAKEMWQGVKKQFNNIVDGAKGLPKRIGDGIRNAKDKAISGMKSVGNSLIKWAGKPYNKVIGGVNWIVEKFTGKKNTISLWPWKTHQYAKGTDGHPGGSAILGDGKGSNSGSEFVALPDGRSFLSADKPTLYPNLPKGTQVLSAKMTKQIPMYADGKGWLSKAWGGVKSFTSKIGEAIGDVWDYVSNPGKLVNKVLDGIGVIKDKAQVPTEFVQAGFNYLKTKPVEFVKKQIDDLMSSAPSAGSGVKRWAGVATNALRMTGQYTKANLDRLLYQMQTESGGNPRAINLWDINAKRGTPSKGLMQVIDPTFQAYKMPGFNNIWNPLDNILASIRYAVSRYGSLARAYRGVGYADGGIINSKQLAWIAEGGWAESIISHDPSKRVRQQRIWQETGDRLGFTDNKYSKQMLAELERIARAVENGFDLSGLSIDMDSRKVGELVEPHVTQNQNRRQRRKRRMP